MENELRLRITVIRPPEGVDFRLQRGKTGTAELIEPSLQSAGSISFDFTVRAADVAGKTEPVFRGPFVQGPSDSRFVYVNAGTLAGQADSCWTRRAKVSLMGISGELIETLRANSNTVLEAAIYGSAGDGGPACATVPLLDGGWKAVRGIAE
jgi:Family of unknown function (DUF5990)